MMTFPETAAEPPDWVKVALPELWPPTSMSPVTTRKPEERL